MFIDENSSPMLRSAFEKGKEEGIKEGMERAAEKLISRARNDPLIHDNTPIGVLRQEAKAIRMELHGLTDEDLQMSDIERENK